MDIKFFLPPLVGAIIGYVTNDIAIRMLFRPFRAYFIGRFHVPFTPGLIPKEQSRIAHAVAHTVSHDLLDESALRAALTGEEMLQRVDALADRIGEKLLTMEDTPEALLNRYAGEERVAGTLDAMKRKAADYICQRLYEAEAGSALTGMIAEKIKSKLPFLPSSMIVPVRDQISTWLNEQILTRCPQLLYDVIGKEADALLQKPVGELLSPHEDRLNGLRGVARQWYLQLIDSALPKLLAAVDIEGIVEQKINSLNPRELEQLLRGLMKRELSAIIWLGCLLGFVMGWVNLLFML
ncbi:MAG: DUF445 family protein [Clostridia bacterium]|nr:DUF445 family protein [Clostridia bacterium]